MFPRIHAKARRCLLAALIGLGGVALATGVLVAVWMNVDLDIERTIRSDSFTDVFNLPTKFSMSRLVAIEIPIPDKQIYNQPKITADPQLKFSLPKRANSCRFIYSGSKRCRFLYDLWLRPIKFADLRISTVKEIKFDIRLLPTNFLPTLRREIEELEAEAFNLGAVF